MGRVLVGQLAVKAELDPVTVEVLSKESVTKFAAAKGAVRVQGKLGFANCGGQPTSNYAFKRTAELALRSKQTDAPQPLNAALEPLGRLSVNSSWSLRAQLTGSAPLWFVFWIVSVLGTFLANLTGVFVVVKFPNAPAIAGLDTKSIVFLACVSYAAGSMYLVWRCRRNSDNSALLWVAEFLPKYFLIGGALMIIAQIIAWVYGAWF